MKRKCRYEVPGFPSGGIYKRLFIFRKLLSYYVKVRKTKQFLLSSADGSLPRVSQPQPYLAVPGRSICPVLAPSLPYLHSPWCVCSASQNRQTLRCFLTKLHPLVMLPEEKGQSHTRGCYPPDMPRPLPCTVVIMEPSAFRRRTGRQGHRSRFLTRILCTHC